MSKTSQFPFLDKDPEFIIFSSGSLNLSAILLICYMVLVQWPSIAWHFEGLLIWSLALMSRSTIQRHTEIWKWQESAPVSPFEPRNMLLPVQIGFSFVRAAVACAIFERTSSFKPHLKLRGIWGFLQYPDVALLPWFPFWWHWCCSSSVWAS